MASVVLLRQMNSSLARWLKPLDGTHYCKLGKHGSFIKHVCSIDTAVLMTFHHFCPPSARCRRSTFARPRKQHQTKQLGPRRMVPDPPHSITSAASPALPHGG